MKNTNFFPLFRYVILPALLVVTFGLLAGIFLSAKIILILVTSYMIVLGTIVVVILRTVSKAESMEGFAFCVLLTLESVVLLGLFCFFAILPMLFV